MEKKMKKILIIDDDPAIRTYLTNLFKDNADFITYGISAMTFPF